jgi:membrane protein
MGIAPSLDAVARHSPVRDLPPPAKVSDAFGEHELFVRASAVAFRGLLTLIPFAMFVLALAGALSLSSLWTNDLAPNLAPHVSAPVFQVIDSTVQKALAGRQLYWVTIGFGLMLWESSAAVRAIMAAFDAIYGVRRERTTRARLLVSAWLALAEVALVLATAAVLHGGPHLVDGPLGAIARYLVAAALLWAAVSLLVRFAPAERPDLDWVSLGSTLVVVGWLVTWSLYGLYVTQIADLGSAFGAFAAVIVLLTFLQLSAIVLLTGTLIDALVAEEVTGDRRGK